MKLAGLDIGTTTLCGLALESDTGEILSVITEPSSFPVPGPETGNRCRTRTASPPRPVGSWVGSPGLTAAWARSA